MPTPIKLQRTWVQSEAIASKNNFWRNAYDVYATPPEAFSEYLVELTTDDRDRFTIIELVTASCIEHAIWLAFQTRNIASNWIATEIEEFGE